jgi:alanyl-tRNA synthetase
MNSKLLKTTPSVAVWLSIRITWAQLYLKISVQSPNFINKNPLHFKMHKFHNSFLFEEKSQVTKVEAKDGFLLVELNDTIFYPGGGGQPCDYGLLINDTFFGEVFEVYKEDEKIIHKAKIEKGELKAGDYVDLIVNKERRTKLIRMHTGEHILFKSLEHALGVVSLNKIDLGEEESSLFISAKEVTWDKLFKAEELANKIIEEDRPIIEKEYPKTDAVILEKIRIKPERIKSDTVRVLEVKDFDWSACHGTHAKSTAYVGNIFITKFNQAKGGYEIRFKTNVKKELFDYAKIARVSASLFENEVEKVPEFIKKLKEQTEQYKERFRKLSYELLDNYKTETHKGINLIYTISEEVEKKQLVDKSASLLKEKTIVCFVNKEEGRATVLLNVSKDLNINAPDLLNKILSKFNGKGGGRDTFAMGSVEEKYSEELIEEIKKII